MLDIKYRPQYIEDVVGQNLDLIKTQIEKNVFLKAHIFKGPSGTGKTTVARIIANNIHNCNYIEIDAASNNGVEFARNLVEEIQIPSPLFESTLVVIDECHTLTTASWQVMLKVIEEPPKGVHFIFCTTEGNKIPETIKTRCHTVEFNLIDTKVIEQRLKEIREKENLKVDNSTIHSITNLCSGSMRRAILLLEKCSYGDYVVEVENSCYNLLDYLLRNNTKQFIEYCYELNEAKLNFKDFSYDFFKYCLNLYTYVYTKGEIKVETDHNALELIETTFDVSQLKSIVRTSQNVYIKAREGSLEVAFNIFICDLAF